MKERQFLSDIIQREVFVPKAKEHIVSTLGTDSRWIFDFRRVLMRPQVLRSIASLFLEELKNTPPFQIGGIEVAAIPLITGLVMALSEEGYESNAFFIRKSRKKYGLLRMIEGEVTDEKIILVDDIINTGKSFIRQVEVIESLGKKVDTIFAILRFRDLEYYKYFHDKNIKIVSLFTLDDFTDTLNVTNSVNRKETSVPMPFHAEWIFHSENPNYFYVISKSAPVIDDNKIYFGSDNGTFWALNQNNGSISWQYNILGSGKKMIFSTPILHKDSVYFGAYDGNFYALDINTGKKKWIFMEADWIKSSPTIAPDIDLIYVGLQYGLWNKRDGLVALNAVTGEKKWEYISQDQISSSPAYTKKYQLIITSIDNSIVYALDARAGTVIWELQIGGVINSSFNFDKEESVVTFCSSDGYAYVLETSTGRLLHKIHVAEFLYSTPIIHEGWLYVASLDKHLYCIELATERVLWKFETNGRIFASPQIIDGKVYIGSNDSRFYEIDSQTGINTAFFQSTERITSKNAYNPQTKRFFVPTFANEIYCLVRQ